MRPRRIGVLCGTNAVRIGQEACAALSARGRETVPLFADRDLDLQLRDAGVDVVLIVEDTGDASVQALCELRGVPYTGCGPLGAALSRDKLKARELLRLHNVPTPSYYVHRRGAGTAAEQHGSFGYPARVQPRSGGSLEVVFDAESLEAATDAALRLDDHLVVERVVDGPLLRIAIFGGRAFGAVDPSLPSLTEDRRRSALTVAEQAARALDADGLVEAQVIVSPRGNEVVVDVDLLPRLSQDAVVTHLCAAAGQPYGTLLETLADDARLHGRRRTAEDRRLRDAIAASALERRAQPSETH